MARKRQTVEIKIVKETVGLEVGKNYHVDSYTAKVLVDKGSAEEVSAKKKPAPKKAAPKKTAEKKTEAKKSTKKED